MRHCQSIYRLKEAQERTHAPTATRSDLAGNSTAPIATIDDVSGGKASKRTRKKATERVPDGTRVSDYSGTMAHLLNGAKHLFWDYATRTNAFLTVDLGTAEATRCIHEVKNKLNFPESDKKIGWFS